MPHEISRRNFLKSGVGTAFIGFAAAQRGETEAPATIARAASQPNVVLITMDTTRFDRLGFNGYPRGTSPYLDKMAAQGVVFRRNYCQAPFTAPSIASLMTSRYPSDLGHITNRKPELAASHITLAHALKARGYQTYGVTSAFILSARNGFAQGFDWFSSPDLAQHGAQAAGVRAIRSCEESTNELKANLSVASESVPRFYWLHYYDAHMPYCAPDSFTFKFTSKGPYDDTRKDFYGYLAARDGSGNGSRAGVRLLTEREVVAHSDQYDGQIAYIDNTIASFMSYMTDRGLFAWDRDLFVLTSDHEELLGEQECLALHEGGYSEVAHVPLLMAGAGLPQGKKVDALTANLDVVPTILSITSAKEKTAYQDHPFRGKNLVPLMLRDAPAGSRAIMTELTHDEGHAVHTERYSLIKRIYKPAKLAASEGYSPSGVTLRRDESPGSRELAFTWRIPGGVEKEVDSARLVIDVVCAGEALQLMDKTLNSAIDTTLRLSHAAQFWPETKWNLLATFEKLQWRVEALNRNGAVAYDTSQVTPLEFKLQPTENFCLLFDLNEEKNHLRAIQNRRNLCHDTSRNDTMKELEELIAAHLAQVGGSTKATRDTRDMSDEELEALRALGYF